jgi:hypothetical protein
MKQELIGWWMSNLFIPGDPPFIKVKTPICLWELQRSPNYQCARHSIRQIGGCANTYSIYARVAPDDTIIPFAGKTLLNDIIALCLGLSYICGQAVSLTTATTSSSIRYFSNGNRLPKHRPIAINAPLCSNNKEFVDKIEAFTAHYYNLNEPPTIQLLVHVWLDVISSMSLEGLIINLATLFEIIGNALDQIDLKKSNTHITNSCSELVSNVDMRRPQTDISELRSLLIKNGTIPSPRERSTSDSCLTSVATDYLNMADISIHKILSLGPVLKSRFTLESLSGLQSYSSDS